LKEARIMRNSCHLSRPRRLFTRYCAHPAGSLLAFAAIVVTACAEAPPAPPPTDYSNIELEWVVMQHDVAFDRAQSVPDARTLAGIDSFLDAAEVRMTDEIALAPGSGTDRGLATQRAEALGAALRRRLPGIRVRLLDSSAGPTDRLIVGRYVAIQPECPGWQTPEQRYAAFRNPDNRPDDNFGCTTAKNLAAMIANPGDLKYGRTLTPADAASQALAIERYRALESPHPHSPTSYKNSEVE
jgi:pilus assembly protein CpaD